MGESSRKNVRAEFDIAIGDKEKQGFRGHERKGQGVSGAINTRNNFKRLTQGQSKRVTEKILRGD